MATALFGNKQSSDNRNTRKRRWIKHTIFKRDGGRCFWCGRSLTMDARVWPIPFNLATTDHIVPKSQGGTDTVDNTVLSCFPCNGDRGDMQADEYLRLIKAREAQGRWRISSD